MIRPIFATRFGNFNFWREYLCWCGQRKNVTLLLFPLYTQIERLIAKIEPRDSALLTYLNAFAKRIFIFMFHKKERKFSEVWRRFTDFCMHLQCVFQKSDGDARYSSDFPQSFRENSFYLNEIFTRKICFSHQKFHEGKTTESSWNCIGLAWISTHVLLTLPSSKVFIYFSKFSCFFSNY